MERMNSIIDFQWNISNPDRNRLELNLNKQTKWSIAIESWCIIIAKHKQQRVHVQNNTKIWRKKYQQTQFVDKING